MKRVTAKLQHMCLCECDHPLQIKTIHNKYTIKNRNYKKLTGKEYKISAVKLFNFQNLYKAYKSCLRGKTNARAAAEFEINREKNLCQMSRSLSDRSYRPGVFTCFPYPTRNFAKSGRRILRTELFTICLSQKLNRFGKEFSSTILTPAGQKRARIEPSKKSGNY